MQINHPASLRLVYYILSFLFWGITFSFYSHSMEDISISVNALIIYITAIIKFELSNKTKCQNRSDNGVDIRSCPFNKRAIFLLSDPNAYSPSYVPNGKGIIVTWRRGLPYEIFLDPKYRLYFVSVLVPLMLALASFQNSMPHIYCNGLKCGSTHFA